MTRTSRDPATTDELAGPAPLHEIVVSAVDRGGNEGPAITLRPAAIVNPEPPNDRLEP